MSTENMETLRSVAIKVLERFAFLLADPLEHAVVASHADGFWLVQVIFRGPRQGALALIATPILARQLAANLYGYEQGDEVTPEQAEDALKELLNVICGDYLHRMDGSAAIYDLSAPECSAITGEAVQLWLKRHAHGFLSVEGHPMILSGGD
ncbi:MAG: chemotaxis protein CheX [bacterium]